MVFVNDRFTPVYPREPIRPGIQDTRKTGLLMSFVSVPDCNIPINVNDHAKARLQHCGALLAPIG